MDKATGYIYRNDGDMRSHEFFLYGLVRGIKPKRILEIGVRTGISTMTMMQAVMDDRIQCDYHICDIDPACLNLEYPFPITSHIMASDDLATQWDKRIDLLMIDGCHEYSQVHRDLVNFMPYVLPSGFILLHDTNPSEQDKHPGACWDAYKILDDIRKNAEIWNIEYLTLPYSYGLTVIKRNL